MENLTTVRGCFGLGTARVKALGELKKYTYEVHMPTWLHPPRHNNVSHDYKRNCYMYK